MNEDKKVLWLKILELIWISPFLMVLDKDLKL